jgi:hypothetical protein
MSQAINFELLPNGRELVMLGDETIPVNQRMIRLGHQRLMQGGLIEKDIPGFSEKIINGASKINSMLNIESDTKNTDPSINVFWFDLGENLNDQIYLKIPMVIDGFTQSALVMLSVDHGHGQKFIQALRNQALDQDMMNNLLTEILRINKTQEINKSQILCTKLIVYPDSSTHIAENAVKFKTNPTELHQVNKDQIISSQIPAKIDVKNSEIESVPLDEFVQQSVFFRSNQEDKSPEKPSNIYTKQVEDELPKPKTNIANESQNPNHKRDPSWPDQSKPMKFGEIPPNIFAALIIPELRSLGRENNNAGSILNPEIPFPKLEGMNQNQIDDAMYQFVTQPDVINYIDWNLDMRSAQSQIESLDNELNNPKSQNFSFAGDRNYLQQMRDTWIFIRDHLDDPRLEWLKIIDQHRHDEQKKISDVKVNMGVSADQEPHKLTGDEKKSTTSADSHPGNTQDSDALWQQVTVKKEVPEWMLRNFMTQSADAVLSYFKKLAENEPDKGSWYKAIEYVLNNLDDFPVIKIAINERGN